MRSSAGAAIVPVVPFVVHIPAPYRQTGTTVYICFPPSRVSLEVKASATVV